MNGIDLLQDVDILQREGDWNIEISNVATDSRQITQGFVFIAVVGLTVDGHDYIDGAIEKGASMIVCESLPRQLIEDVCYVVVKNSARSAGIIAHNFYGRPTTKARLIGITGTNGKTTIATILYRLMRFLGFKAGLVSTVEIMINDEVIPSTVTTPDQVSLNRVLGQMVDAGCEYIFMEVSSHAVVQHRIAGLVFAVAGFTNLTHDHLDYHGSFAEYRDAKKAFFDGLLPSGVAVSNADDANGSYMLQNTKADCRFYSLRSMVDYKGRLLSSDFNGLEIDVNGQAFHSRLIGRFNALNILAAYGIMDALGVDNERIVIGLSAVHPPAGRFEFVKRSDGVVGIIDYAHTPDAVKNILETVQDIKGTRGKMITLVGCGGDRDKTKRPEMARIACQLSEMVILTSDNPRSEDPATIIEEMEAGIPEGQDGDVLSITDRAQAIKTASKLAKPHDVIVIAGKGHEKYQEVNGEKLPFDDKAILMALFER